MIILVTLGQMDDKTASWTVPEMREKLQTEMQNVQGQGRDSRMNAASWHN